MQISRIIAAAGCAALLGTSAMSAIRPAPAQGLTAMPMPLTMAAGARMGSTASAKHSDLGGTGAVLAIAGLAAVGVGAAAAAGAFDHNHHDSVSP